MLFFCALLLGPALCLFPIETGAATLFQQVDIASPPVPVGSGARAMGMGGAFIATADDATAASWNPAGLIQLEKPEISIVGAYAHHRMDMDSTIHPESETCSNDRYAALNYFSAAVPVHWFKNIVFSINYQRLYDFERSLQYQIDYAQSGLDLRERRVFDQNGYLSAVGLAAAIELTPRLSVGGTLNVWTDQLGWDNGWSGRYRSDATGTQAGVPVAIHTVITEAYEKFRGINFNLGLLWETSRWGRFGAVIKTPFTASMVHHYRLEQTTDDGSPPPSTVVSTLDEEVDLSMPLSYGAGWSMRFNDHLTVGLDIARTHWDDYALTDGMGNKFSPIDGRRKAESRVDPTTHVRIGGEYVLLMPGRQMAVPLRAGLFYDPEPGHDGSQDFFGISLGGGLTMKSMSLDLAYQLRWGQDVDTGNLIAGSDADVYQHRFLASLIYYF